MRTRRKKGGRGGYRNSQLSLVTNKAGLHLLVFLCAVLFYPEGYTRKKEKEERKKKREEKRVKGR